MTKPASIRHDKKHPLTDAERHKRFIETAEEVGAADSDEAFDRAFSKVVNPPKRRA